MPQDSRRQAQIFAQLNLNINEWAKSDGSDNGKIQTHDSKWTMNYEPCWGRTRYLSVRSPHRIKPSRVDGFECVFPFCIYSGYRNQFERQNKNFKMLYSRHDSQSLERASRVSFKWAIRLKQDIIHGELVRIVVSHHQGLVFPRVNLKKTHTQHRRYPHLPTARLGLSRGRRQRPREKQSLAVGRWFHLDSQPCIRTLIISTSVVFLCLH